MIQKDSRFQNLKVSGVLAIEKVPAAVQTGLPIVANGPWTLYRKIFTPAELPPSPVISDFNIDIDTSNSRDGDRLAIFLRMPIPYNWNSLRVNFPLDKVYITTCGPDFINNYIRLFYDAVAQQNQRFRMCFVFSAGRFIATTDSV